ncbi:hypothetical protein HY970_02500 [Candidatus Kaiserbacteria bacterium]|nr:hypothetical protein [Candidatus Kaiserbacteria bacterium]
MLYSHKIRDLLSPHEQRLFRTLNSPQKIQNYLDTLPINFELSGETYMSPRRVMQDKTAHCMEGALFAAAVLAYHGEKPLLLDLQTTPEDEDHVVALYIQEGRWGAISKTNHAILRHRDPVYLSVRELATSYFHEYIHVSGKRTLLAFSAPFDLRRFAPEKWVTAEADLEWMVEKLDSSKHFPIAPKKNLQLIRKASGIELRASEITEWSPRAPRTGAGERRKRR